MNPQDPLTKTLGDALVSNLPPDIRKLFRTYQKHQERFEKEQAQNISRAQTIARQMEMNRLLNEILKHSEELQIKLDQETERRKAAEQKEKFWQRASFAIGIGGLILTVGGIILTLLLAVPKG